MFLITTADRRFLKMDEKVLLLGEWCKFFKDREMWSGIDHEVLPYHWDDRGKFASDWQYLNATYEKYLALFAERLNRIHGVKYSDRYWRILIGLWLRCFIDAVYDRYLSIRTAEKSGRVTNTWICSTDAWSPEDVPSFSFDSYNLYLYSRIIKNLGTIPYEEKDLGHASSPLEKARKKTDPAFLRLWNEIIRQMRKGLKTVIRQGFAVLAVEVYPRLMRTVPTKVVFAGSIYLPLWDQIRLQFSLGQLPFLYHGEKIVLDAISPNQAMRNDLALPDSLDPFERLLNELLPEQIPMIYVENYKRAHKKALAISPESPKVVITAFSMNYRRCFEFWAAYHSECSGTKLLINQHGGGYGTARHSSVEEHFVRVCDRYYTWGSPLDEEPKVKPMPSFRLWKAARALNSFNPAGCIMWVSTTVARYKTCAESGIVGPHMLRYINEQERFLRRLCSEPRDLLLWRYFNDLWEEQDRWKEFYPQLKMQRGHKKQLGKESDFISELKKCRLAIHTANETTYLETLAADFPSLIFWNPVYYEARESLQPYFDELRAVGILHYTPESAADMVNKIYKDPGQWWNSPDVQNARKNFCDRLARTSDDWLGQWKEELNSRIRGNA